MKTLIVMVMVFFFSARSVIASESPPDPEPDVGNRPRVGVFTGNVGTFYSFQDYGKDSFLDDGSSVTLKDAKLATAFFQLDYRSPDYHGLEIDAGITGYSYFDRAGQEPSIREDRDHFILHNLSLRYALSETTLVFGRQEFPESAFLDKYYEAISLFSHEWERIGIFLAAIRKHAEADIDAFLDFRNVDEEDPGTADILYAAEVSLTGVPESFFSKFYYYRQERLFSLYGTHIAFARDVYKASIGFELDYYYSEEDDSHGLTDESGEAGDGNISHIALSFEFDDLSLTLGHMKADEDVGAREGGLIDDSFNPFDEGDNAYAPDAETWYGALSFNPRDVLLECVYGGSRYRGNGRRFTDREFNIRAEARLWNTLAIETRYIRVDSDGPEGSYSKFEIELLYGFY